MWTQWESVQDEVCQQSYNLSWFLCRHVKDDEARLGGHQQRQRRNFELSIYLFKQKSILDRYHSFLRFLHNS